jgi:hypothetical protein
VRPIAHQAPSSYFPSGHQFLFEVEKVLNHYQQEHEVCVTPSFDLSPYQELPFHLQVMHRCDQSTFCRHAKLLRHLSICP